jgi:hypothetical protein
MASETRTTTKTATLVLTEEEEKVYRMAHGATVGETEELGRKGADNPIAAARVQDFERELMARIRKAAAGASDSPVKGKIVAALRSKNK